MENALRDYDDLLLKTVELHPDRVAICDSSKSYTWLEVERKANAIANSILHAGVKANDRVAVLSENSADYALILIGIIRAGACAVPLSTMMAERALARTVADSGAKMLFAAPDYVPQLQKYNNCFAWIKSANIIGIGDQSRGSANFKSFKEFVQGASEVRPDVGKEASAYFNLIYSSGTTGAPKGILHDRSFRTRMSLDLADGYRMTSHSTALVSTPLYSNTTLFLFFAMIAAGGKTMIMEKFDASQFLQISEREKVTHAVLVPVQYRKLLSEQDFASYDLSSYVAKFCTSSPLQSALKRRILDDWPAGGLTEFYGMTEGGVSTILEAHDYPDKLNTVGRVPEDGEILILDEDGLERSAGEAGEVVGWSSHMMVGYHNRADATLDASWYHEDGRRFQRSGDIGWFDPEGFLHLLDRKKDVIISGGFNIYAVDLEQALIQDPFIADVAVVAGPSEKWGETPVAFIVPADKSECDPDRILTNANSKLGKLQRLSEIRLLEELPRNALGKVLKRDLREQLQQAGQLEPDSMTSR